MTLYTLGLGCRRGTPFATIASAVRAALGAAWSMALLPEVADADADADADGACRAGVPPPPIRLQAATLDAKATEPGLLAYCAHHGLPLRVFPREALARVTARTWGGAPVAPPSDAARARFGIDGVCELAALCASPQGVLLVPKTSLHGVSVALAGPASAPAASGRLTHDRR